MLISFVVENFRSFDGAQEFSMVASTRQTSFPEHLVEVPGTEEKLVPIAAIYGANGAGKSNLVRAISWLKDAVVERRAPRLRSFAFGTQGRPTKFEARFLSDGVVLEYGLTRSEKRIEEEWLSVVSATGRSRSIFERLTTNDEQSTIEFANDLDGSSEKIAAFKVLGVKGTEPVLRRLREDMPLNELPREIRSAITWFDRLSVIGPDAEIMKLIDRVLADQGFREFATDLLRKIDPSLSSVTTTTRSLKINSLPDVLKDKINELEHGESLQLGPQLGSISVRRIDENTASIPDVGIEHKALSSELQSVLPLGDESDGTRRLLDLAPNAFDASNDVVVVVDELDRSLHALLAREFVLEFLRRARGHRSQLIFTTHETHLLDQDLVRRDEVWFVEKTEGGASQLFSLDDFKVRNDLRLDRSYLQGRFGAIPPLGNDA